MLTEETDVFGDAFTNSINGLPEEWLNGPVILGAHAGRWAALLAAAGLGLCLGWLSAWPARLLLQGAKSRAPGGD